MLASDALVSDYSSIFYDYRLLDRPMVVHAPDLEWYRDVERGFYGRWPEELGLPVSRDQRALEEILGGELSAGSHDGRPASAGAAVENADWLCRWVLEGGPRTDQGAVNFTAG